MVKKGTEYKRKKTREEKEKTKKGRKTATIVWSCCRLASLGRLTLLLRLFGSEREKMRTRHRCFYCSCLHILQCVCAGARAFRPMKYQQQAMQLDDERIEGKRESNILVRILNDKQLCHYPVTMINEHKLSTK